MSDGRTERPRRTRAEARATTFSLSPPNLSSFQPLICIRLSLHNLTFLLAVCGSEESKKTTAWELALNSRNAVTYQRMSHRRLQNLGYTCKRSFPACLNKVHSRCNGFLRPRIRPRLQKERWICYNHILTAARHERFTHEFNHFHKEFKEPFLSSPPQKTFCVIIVFDFSWDDYYASDKLETMVMLNFGGNTWCTMVFVNVVIWTNLRSYIRCLGNQDCRHKRDVHHCSDKTRLDHKMENSQWW